MRVRTKPPFSSRRRRPKRYHLHRKRWSQTGRFRNSYDSPLIVVIYLIGFHHPDPWMAELMMSSALLQFRTRKDLPATALLSIPLLVVFCLYHSSVLFATPMALGWASPFAPTIQNSEMLPSALTTAFRCTCAWH